MNKNKKITIIFALIIIIGIIVILTTGFNVEMITKEHKQIRLDLDNEFNTSDIKQIASEVFGGQTVEIQKVEVYEKQVSISTEEITDEQKNDLITKINEKYETDIEAQNVETISVPNIRLRDIVMPYIGTFLLTTGLILLYMIIKYKKISPLKVLVQTILGIIILELLVMSIIAIVRIPIGRNIPSIIFITYIIATFGLTNMFENKLQKIKEEETKKNKKEK